MRSGLSLSLVILRGKLLNLSLWADGSALAVADGAASIRELRAGRVRELCQQGADDWPGPASALSSGFARLAARWDGASPVERHRELDDLLAVVCDWLSEVDRER